MTSFIHQVLLGRNKKHNWPYMSSIMVINEKIPLFEEHFGQLDYDWLLRITKERKCKEIDPCVIRYKNGMNLSLTSEYRKRDFYYSLMILENRNKKGIKNLYGTRARYFYFINDMKSARRYFLKAKKDWKTILYLITTFWGSNFIRKHFHVFG